MTNAYFILVNNVIGGDRMIRRKYTIRSNKSFKKVHTENQHKKESQRKLNEGSANNGCQQLVLSEAGR